MDTFLLVSSILLWIVVLLNLFLTLALVRRINAAPGSLPDVENGLPTGTPAPDFSAQTLEGKKVTLADYAGHATTFIFVASFCEPCHEILPSLQKLAAQARAAGTTLALVNDGNQQETEEMMRTVGGQVEVLIAPRHENSFFTNYHIAMTPSYCSLDERGTIVRTGHPGSTDQGWQQLLMAWSQQASVADARH